MGYRNYLYIADKDKIEQIKDMNKEELIKFVGQEDEEYPPHFLDIFDKIEAEEVHEAGKYIDYYKEIEQYMKPLFTNPEVHKYHNEENELMLADSEILQKIATIYKEKVQAHYKDLLQENSSNKYDKRTQLERLIDSVQSNLTWSSYLDKLDNNKYSLGGGWLYEHEVFNILFLMKTIDFNKKCLIWCGY